MRVHLFALCWNDADMLPFFFRHYDRFVSRYVIFDDGSTDGSLDMLRAHPRVELHHLRRADPNSFAISEQLLSNDCWKTHRFLADWVIVTDIDEHLYHPDFPSMLTRYRARGITAVPALGFQMISEEFPADHELLCETRLYGAPWANMCKLSLFDPSRISEINFTIGRHTAEPEGHVVFPDQDELMLLHYKYLGFERTHARHRQMLGGLGEQDLANGWGHKYSWSRVRLRADWDEVAQNAVNIRDVQEEPSATYPLTRWWTRYRSWPQPG